VVTRGAAEFEVTSLDGGRRGRGPGASAALVAVAVALLVGAGLLSSAVTPPVAPTPSPSLVAVVEATPGLPSDTPSLPSDTPGRLSPTHGPAASLSPSTATRQLSISALVAGVLNGSLADKVVFVDGRMGATARHCSPGAVPAACLLLQIDGLRGVRVITDTGPGAWPSDPSPSAVLVLRVDRHNLVYLGSLVVSVGGIPGVGYLTGDFNVPGSRLTPPANLAEADGMLLRNGDTLCSGSVTSCGRTVPAIVPVVQSPFGNLTYGEPVPVAIAPVVTGTDPANAWTNGPFLLRRLADGDCAFVPSCPVGASWVVVAREAPGGVVSVELP
jgi:hypothetical protein